jgi:hypothetical protein
MAHRKQIKVTKQKQTDGESSSNKCKNITKTSVMHKVPKETDSSDAIVAEPGPSLEPQASMSQEPEPGIDMAYNYYQLTLIFLEKTTK